MALVVLLRGVNVGGHRTFRPTTLAEELKHLDAVNIGAAGTFVIRERITRAQLRAELSRRLPFDADVMICEGREARVLGNGAGRRSIESSFALQDRSRARPDNVRSHED